MGNPECPDMEVSEEGLTDFLTFNRLGLDTILPKDVKHEESMKEKKKYGVFGAVLFTEKLFL